MADLIEVVKCCFICTYLKEEDTGFWIGYVCSKYDKEVNLHDVCGDFKVIEYIDKNRKK